MNACTRLLRPLACAFVLLIAASGLAQSRPASDIQLVGVAAIQADAQAMRPLVKTPLAREFLAAADALPRIQKRELLRNPKTRRLYDKSAAAALSEAERAALQPAEIDENFYYVGRYGSPVAYSRALEILGTHDVEALNGKRILDFGYGTIGQLRMLASMGAEVVGVDVDPNLPVLYGDASDQGLISGPKQRSGKLALVCGRWPAEAAAKDAVGGSFDLILSKNTLKNGYINPEREVDKRMLVDLGVSNAEFVKALFEALRPGGHVLIYNLCPAPAKPDKPYIPWADGRSPFSREMWESAGFRVLAFDVNDDKSAREMGAALGWDAGDRAMDLETDLFALWTLVQRPRER